MNKQPEVELPEFSIKKDIAFVDVDTFLNQKGGVILDTRTPSEYRDGHIEGAINFPLFEDDERKDVGTIYKKIGRDQAVERGLEYVGGKLAGFVKSAKSYGRTKRFYLYCWRGGMRSRSMAWLLSTAGFDVTVLNGGYKAFRQNFNIVSNKEWKFVVILGNTGIGKTELLNELEKAGEQVLDLECLANHKGSAFGSFGLGEQPTTEEFINKIHHKLRGFDVDKTVWVEGESISIGSCYMPNEFYQKIANAPYFVASMSKNERVERLVKEYGFFDEALIVDALMKVSKRMGGNNVKEAIESFRAGDVARSIEITLDYYDKGYNMASSKHKGEHLGDVKIENGNHKDVALELIKNNRL